MSPAHNSGLNVADELLRPAGEAAVALARLGRDQDPRHPPPRRLQRFLDFARLPDQALSVVCRFLDDDESFRTSVRDATSEELVGRGSWLFLDRPPGWEDDLGRLAAAAQETAVITREAQVAVEATRRLARVEETLRRAEAEVASLRSELAEAKQELTNERRSRRLAGSEAGRLRARVAEAESNDEQWRLRVAALEAALARTASGDAGSGPAVSSDGDGRSNGNAGGAGPGPVDNSASEIGRGQATAEEPPSPWSDVDQRALAEAVAAGVAATSALLDVLADVDRRIAPILTSPEPSRSEVPPGLRSPARPARQPVTLPPAVLDDSVAAAEYLVRVDGVLVLVDGYNVTKLARPELSLPEQRHWLVDAAVELAARTGARLELIFDGVDEGSAPADFGRRTGVQVRFSPSGVEADDLLLDLVHGRGAMPAVVASDDRRVRDGARRLDANVISARQLLWVLRRPLE